MTFNPIIALLLFIASIAVGALLIYLKIQFDSRHGERISPLEAALPPAERLILSSEGFDVYRSVSPGSGQSPMYYLDIDDRVITAIRDASAKQHAGIRCVLPQQVLQNLANAVRSTSDGEDTQT